MKVSPSHSSYPYGVTWFFCNFVTVLIEGVLFRARYLGSTQLICEGQPTKATRMMQAEEAVSRIKVSFSLARPFVAFSCVLCLLFYSPCNRLLFSPHLLSLVKFFAASTSTTSTTAATIIAQILVCLYRFSFPLYYFVFAYVCTRLYATSRFISLW